MLPRIGITGSVMATPMGTRRTFLNEPYVVGVRDAGGLPLLLTPAHREASLRALYTLLDGLLLTGGEDVDPARYGVVTVHPSVETVPDRDTLEFGLLRWALADDLPVFAICRGMQLLNVALGGSLHQDLSTERPGPLGHDQMKAQPPVPRVRPSHAVTVEPGSRLASLTGGERLEVNSMHHQAVKALAPRLSAVAHAPDGVVEGVEPLNPTSATFLVGVQWHPEELLREDDPPSRRLFEAFLTAAAKRARR